MWQWHLNNAGCLALSTVWTFNNKKKTGIAPNYYAEPHCVDSREEEAW